MSWVDVNDRLPKYKGDYLCVLDTWGHKYVHVCGFTKNLEKFDNVDFAGKKHAGFYNYDSEYGFFERDNVTHWMPIPALP